MYMTSTATSLPIPSTSTTTPKKDLTIPDTAYLAKPSSPDPQLAIVA
jgi:hypothetical protein